MCGYKDLKGNIKIPAVFHQSIPADSFYNIIAVIEKTDSSFNPYYLLKNGRRVGKDSVFMFDFTYACESEGKILYQDKKKDRVGFFDKNGVVIIPAIYNAASPFRNGLAIALRNAKRQCWNESEDTLNCEHVGWNGGEIVLINEKNEILADNITTDNLGNINWYSLKMNNSLVDSSIYVSIKGVHGNIYSFINYEKEFEKWFHAAFFTALKSADKNNLQKLLLPEITYWENKSGWISLNSANFLKSFPTVLTKEKFKENNWKKISIGSEGNLNNFIFTERLYKKFYTACGVHWKEKFPVFNVVVTYYKNRTTPLVSAAAINKTGKPEFSDFDKTHEIAYQKTFQFIRTERGYKVLSVLL